MKTTAVEEQRGRAGAGARCMTAMALTLLAALVGTAARGAGIDASVPRGAKAGKTAFKQESFTFVRIQYDSARALAGRGGGAMWSTDWPDSDRNFAATFQQETGLKTDPDGKVLRLTDPDLGSHPFLYMVEAGDLVLSEAEVVALRSYLEGGGFLLTDDSWGEREWAHLADQMRRVFPDRQPREIPIEHELFHCWFDIRQKPQVPNIATGIQSQFTGITWEREDARQPQYRGLFDDRGRLMALFCHNTDLGDGWEREGDHPYYFQEFSQKKAYPMGINAVVHALTR